MSHNVLITNVKITSLSALRRAIGELKNQGVNIALLEQNHFRTYRGQPTNCDLCISLPSEAHDVGLRKQADGSYAPIYDPYGMSRNGQGISCQLSNSDLVNRNPQDTYQRSAIGKLLQLYSACVAEDSLSLEGYMPVREVGENGEIFVTVEY